MTCSSIDLTDSLREVHVAASRLNAKGIAEGCGCPTWNYTGDDIAPHGHGCPVVAVQDVFSSFCEVGPGVQMCLDFAQGGQVWNAMREQLAELPDTTLFDACVAYGLALVGAAELRVRDRAMSRAYLHALSELPVERYAVLDQLCGNPETPEDVSLLVCHLLYPDQPTPYLQVDDAAELLVNLVRTVNLESVWLAKTAKHVGSAYTLSEYASRGFNLIAGLRP